MGFFIHFIYYGCWLWAVPPRSQSLDWLCYFISQGVHKICMLTNHDFGFTARLTPLPAITLDNKKQAARSGNLFVKVMEGVQRLAVEGRMTPAALWLFHYLPSLIFLYSHFYRLQTNQHIEKSDVMVCSGQENEGVKVSKEKVKRYVKKGKESEIKYVIRRETTWRKDGEIESDYIGKIRNLIKMKQLTEVK